MLVEQTRQCGTEETGSAAEIRGRRRGSETQVKHIGVIIKGGKTRTESKHRNCTWEFKLKQEVGTELNWSQQTDTCVDLAEVVQLLVTTGTRRLLKGQWGQMFDFNQLICNYPYIFISSCDINTKSCNYLTLNEAGFRMFLLNLFKAGCNATKTRSCEMEPICQHMLNSDWCTNLVCHFLVRLCSECQVLL